MESRKTNGCANCSCSSYDYSFDSTLTNNWGAAAPFAFVFKALTLNIGDATDFANRNRCRCGHFRVDHYG